MIWTPFSRNHMILNPNLMQPRHHLFWSSVVHARLHTFTFSILPSLNASSCATTPAVRQLRYRPCPPQRWHFFLAICLSDCCQTESNKLLSQNLILWCKQGACQNDNQRVVKVLWQNAFQCQHGVHGGERQTSNVFEHSCERTFVALQQWPPSHHVMHRIASALFQEWFDLIQQLK